MKSKPRPRSLFRIIFGRTTFVIVGLLLQIAFFFSIFHWLGNYIHFVYAGYVLVSASVVIAILNKPMDSSFKMAWIIPVLLIPIFGIVLYVFVQVQFQTRALARRVNQSVEKTKPYLVQDPQVQKRGASPHQCRKSFAASGKVRQEEKSSSRRDTTSLVIKCRVVYS